MSTDLPKDTTTSVTQDTELTTDTTTSSPEPLSLQLSDIEGSWSVIYTDFAWWIDGDKPSHKLRPTFNYKLNSDGKTLEDIVRWTNKNNNWYDFMNPCANHTEGIDFPLNEQNTSFLWRMNQVSWWLTNWITSTWHIRHIVKNGQDSWMLIEFSPSQFTEAGWDVVSINPNPSEQTRAEMNKIVQQFGVVPSKLVDVSEKAFAAEPAVVVAADESK